MNLDDFRLEIRRLHNVPAKTVPQGAGSAEDAAIRSALSDYSKRRPQLRRAEKNADGSSLEYRLADLVEDWDDTIHTLRSVRFPANTPDERQLDDKSWDFCPRVNGSVVRFDRALGGYAFAIEFYAPHELTADSSTILAGDLQAVAWLAAAYVLEKAANEKAGNSATSINADAVSQDSPTKSYAFQAKDARQFFDDHFEGTRTNRSTRVSVRTDYHRGRGPLSKRRQSRSRP